jgi:hypothetical protein
MLSKLFKGLTLAAASTALAYGAAQAHEQAVGLTEIVVKTGAGGSCADAPCRIEIAHRLSIHDAESTLMSVLGARADLVGDPDAQAKFANYVAARFQISNSATSEDIQLTLLGGEVERGYYWVYQEGLTPAGSADVSITQSVLMDAIPQQTNRLNIKSGPNVTTLIFTGDATTKSYSLP